jgi:hypothetical protein
MDVEKLGKFGQRLLTPDGSANFALKAGESFRRGRLLIVSPALRASWPPSGRNSTHLTCPNSSGQLWRPSVSTAMWRLRPVIFSPAGLFPGKFGPAELTLRRALSSRSR